MSDLPASPPSEASPPPPKGATSPPPPQPGRPASATGNILRVITLTQNTSALVFGTFLGLHIAAPLAAAVGGLDAADGIMVLGREVYLPLEPVLVYGALGAHLAAALARRAVLAWRTRRLPRLSTHALTGWALVPLVVPHLLLHRIIPADPAPPIGGLSPSEFGFEFVAHAVATRPWMVAGYVALAGVGVWHAVVGSMKVTSWLKRLGGSKSAGHGAGAATITPATTRTPPITTEDEDRGGKSAPASKISKKRRVGLRGLLAAFVGVIAVGLYRLSGENDGLSLSLTNRYEAVFAAAPWTAIGLR